jgi:hypothetical protein
VRSTRWSRIRSIGAFQDFQTGSSAQRGRYDRGVRPTNPAGHDQTAHGSHPDAVFLAYRKRRLGHESGPGSQEVQKLLGAVETSTHTGLLNPRSASLRIIYGSTLLRLQAQFLNAYSTLPCPPLPCFAAEIGVCHRAHPRSAAALPDLMRLSLFRP